MVDLADGGSEIESKVSSFGKDYGWLTGSAAFYASVTAKFNPTFTSGLSFTEGQGYPFNFQGFGDFVKQVSGVSIPGWSGGAQRTLNVAAAFNKENAAAVGLILLEEMFPNKHTRTLKNVLVPPLVGWGIGKVFDDPPSSGGRAQINYNNPSQSNLGRAVTVPQTRAWTDV